MKNSLNFLSEQKNLNGRYTIKDKLGSGNSSEVFECLDNQTGELKAIKIYGDETRIIFRKEMKIMQKISEINSSSHIKWYEGGIEFLSEERKSKKKMYAILELGNHGSLYEAVERTKNGFSEDVCKFLLLQIIKAVDDLHKNGICHRDLKTENMVLVGKNYDVKLCDFGFSTKFLKKNKQKKKLKNHLGTEYYMAPEIIEDIEYDGDKIDIFSIGALLFVLMTKKFGFKEAKIYDKIEKKSQLLYELIKEKKYDQYWELLKAEFNIEINSENFKKLYVRMVAYEPKERPTIEQIKNDAWMQDIINASPEQLTFLRNKMITKLLIKVHQPNLFINMKRVYRILFEL